MISRLPLTRDKLKLRIESFRVKRMAAFSARLQPSYASLIT